MLARDQRVDGAMSQEVIAEIGAFEEAHSNGSDSSRQYNGEDHPPIYLQSADPTDELAEEEEEGEFDAED